MSDEQKLSILRQILDKLDDVTKLVALLGDAIYSENVKKNKS
jgi:hypothetical protein